MRMHTPVCSAIHVHCVIPCTVHISIYTRACPLRESTCTYDYVPAAAIRVSRYIMRCTRFSANFSLVLLSAVSFLSFLLRNHRDRDSSWTYVLDVTLVHGAVHVCNVRQGSTSSGWIPRPITVLHAQPGTRAAVKLWFRKIIDLSSTISITGATAPAAASVPSISEHAKNSCSPRSRSRIQSTRALWAQEQTEMARMIKRGTFAISSIDYFF